MTANNDD